MKDVDDRYSPPFEASSASTESPNLQGMREILYLESLYADEIDYKPRLGRRGPSLQAMREILDLEDHYGAAIDYTSHCTQTELGTVLSVTFCVGFLLSAGVTISWVLHWAVELAFKALAGC